MKLKVTEPMTRTEWEAAVNEVTEERAAIPARLDELDAKRKQAISAGQNALAVEAKRQRQDLQDEEEVLQERLDLLQDQLPAIEQREARVRIPEMVDAYKRMAADLMKQAPAAEQEYFRILARLEQIHAMQEQAATQASSIRSVCAIAGVSTPELQGIRNMSGARLIETIGRFKGLCGTQQ